MTTHYLRDADENTVVDVETTRDDIHCVISIKEYSKMLMDALKEGSAKQLIDDFNELQEIRGAYFEGPHGCQFDYITTYQFASWFLSKFAKKYKLFYSED